MGAEKYNKETILFCCNDLHLLTSVSHPIYMEVLI